MSIEQIIAVVIQAWDIAPFPFLIVYVIILGFAWLWIENQVTRFTRKVPGWRSSLPILPLVSSVIDWLIWIGWLILLLWFALFLALTVALLADNHLIGYPTMVGFLIQQAGLMWNQAYQFVIGLLPDFVVASLPGL